MKTYTAFEGRIGRQTWWLSHIITTVLLYLSLAVAFGLLMLFSDDTEASTTAEFVAGSIFGLLLVLIIIASIWSSLAINIKRLHDRGRSGWFILFVFVPFANIWILIEMAFLRGEDEANDYGADPLAEAA
jgi:uncharacterized membrane protein YhaH (DUF805 family)